MGVGVGVGIGIAVGVGVGASVGMGMGVAVGAVVGVGAGRDVAVGVGTGVGAGVGLGDWVGIGARVAVGVAASVSMPAVAVGDGAGSPSQAATRATNTMTRIVGHVIVTKRVSIIPLSQLTCPQPLCRSSPRCKNHCHNRVNISLPCDIWLGSLVPISMCTLVSIRRGALQSCRRRAAFIICSSRGFKMQTTTRDAVAGPRRELDRTDRDNLHYNLRISVWVRWFLLIAWLLQFNYRPNFADPAYIPTMLLAVSLLALNGYVHYRIQSRRTVTWRWALTPQPDEREIAGSGGRPSTGHR